MLSLGGFELYSRWVPLLSFSSLTLFSLSLFFYRRILGFISPSAFGLFLSQRLQFSFGTFSKIQQDNALAFTITYTFIFVNVPWSSNIPVSLFLKLFLFFLLNVNGEEWIYDAQQCRVFKQVKLNAYEFDKREMRFHLRKRVVTFAKKNYKA